ncbi:MAG TPA: RNA polymerase sigma factor, partial [Chitinophagales bacterium]|nr:RNA polymerase sigma factor [Chitinophagales bacterium]
RLYRSLPNFRHESSLSTYLTRIAINLCLNELKRRRLQQQRFRFLSFSNNSNDTDETPSDLQIPDLNQNYAEQLADQELLHKALQNLDDNLKAVVVLRLVEGYSTQETADLLHIPLGTVLSRLARAQTKLRQLLHSEQ